MNIRKVVVYTVVVVALLVTWRCVCRSPGWPPPRVGCDDMVALQVLVDCGSSNCGGNSPVINQFPINGLHSGGCKNLQELSLDRESFRPPPPSKSKGMPVSQACQGTGLTLHATNDELEAMGSDGKVCKGRALVGGVFTITSWKAGTPRQRLSVKIADLAMIPMANEANSVPAYLFSTADGSEAPLCRAEVGQAWGATRQCWSVRKGGAKSFKKYGSVI